MDQAQDRIILGINGNNGMQIKPAATLGAHHGGILDCQHMAAFAASRCPMPCRLRHLLRRHRGIAQQPRQPDFARPVPTKPPHTHAAASNLNQPRLQKRPPFCRRRSPNRPRPIPTIAVAPYRPNHNESESFPIVNRDV
jgi:hypothetical protein